MIETRIYYAVGGSENTPWIAPIDDGREIELHQDDIVNSMMIRWGNLEIVVLWLFQLNSGLVQWAHDMIVDGIAGKNDLGMPAYQEDVLAE